MTRERRRRTHAILRSVSRQPPASLHAADSPCSHLRAAALEDNTALGSLQASPQAPGQTTMQPPQSCSVGGQHSSGQLTGKPTGARPDYRGRWCAGSSESGDEKQSKPDPISPNPGSAKPMRRPHRIPSEDRLPRTTRIGTCDLWLYDSPACRLAVLLSGSAAVRNMKKLHRHAFQAEPGSDSLPVQNPPSSQQIDSCLPVKC
ncbi:UNVERIFIED_CONTAM: hypothetical protein FKN15_015721 [Acipenser sinensis]